MRKLVTMSRENAIELIELVRSKISDVDLQKYVDCTDLYKTDLYTTDPETDFLGVSNGFLSEVIHAITGYEVEVCGNVEKLFQCPCCGFLTLTECYDSMEGTGYDICPYCRWEDDGTTDIYSRRSVNRGSIQDYRDKMQENPNRYYTNKWIKG